MSMPDDSGNPRTVGFLLKRYTGDSTPFTFPQSPVRLVREWPLEPPFAKSDFSRMDETDDGSFYGVPRFVYHIDEGSVAALTQYYRRNIPPGSDILDICSSWVSHYPLEFKETMGRISGTGMNSLELRANTQLSDFKPKNLNIDPVLPYEDASFDIVTCVVSIDYLIHPITVLKEVRRVLRPGGRVIISQSNRCFPTKAISMWLEMNDRQHLDLINGYLQYAGGFLTPQAFDISAKGSGARDPMFIVEAKKA
jgi:SAM-dependent methyltransferase